MKLYLPMISLLLPLQLVMAQADFQMSIFSKTEPIETVEYRIEPPAGFKRIVVDPNSFAAWLRNLPLQPENAPVLDYRNRTFKKSGDSTVAAVTAYKIKDRKLDQCMDILLRFYTAYLIEQNRINDVAFPLPDGLILSWQDWMAGERPYFKGLHFYLQKTAKPDSGFRNFQSYQNIIFQYSGTQAFYHYYKTIPVAEIAIGDFIVKKGNKGHAVMIVDLAKNAKGDMVALIGQGDTPACQFYLLEQPNGSPWFPVNINDAAPALPIKKKMYWDGLRRFDTCL